MSQSFRKVPTGLGNCVKSNSPVVKYVCCLNRFTAVMSVKSALSFFKVNLLCKQQLTVRDYLNSPQFLYTKNDTKNSRGPKRCALWQPSSHDTVVNEQYFFFITRAFFLVLFNNYFYTNSSILSS